MSAELVTIRVLCVTATPHDHELWRQGAAHAGIPVEFDAVAVAAGPTQVAQGGVDVCLFDARVPDADKNRLVAAARAVEPQPVVVAFAPRGDPPLAGVDATLPQPSSPDDARKLVELCARMKVPTLVLVVDDSATMRRIVRKILAASRFALDIHESGEGLDALKRLRDGRFGMVFLDYNMPGLDGIERLSEVRRECPNVAVVMMSSTVDEALADRAHKAGALAFLKKPFYPADVDAVLQRYFGQGAAALV